MGRSPRVDRADRDRRYRAGLLTEDLLRLREQDFPMDGWRVPGEVGLVGSELLYLYKGPASRVAKPSPQLLQRFISLKGANAPAIARFAQRFGVLGLCAEHGLPESHERARGPCPLREEPPGTFRERANDYRQLARVMDGLLTIAGFVLPPNSQPASTELWSPLLKWPPPRGLVFSVTEGLRLAPKPGVTLEEDRYRLALAVHRLIGWSDLRPLFHWDSGDRPRLDSFHGGSLFAELSLRLALAITGGRALSKCVGCGGIFAEPRRRGRPRKYCRECGDQARMRAAHERRREKRAVERGG
jgi:hypothetical protein